VLLWVKVKVYKLPRSPIFLSALHLNIRKLVKINYIKKIEETPNFDIKSYACTNLKKMSLKKKQNYEMNANIKIRALKSHRTQRKTY